MKKETKNIEYYCDMCGTHVLPRIALRNDGSFQTDIFHLKEHDLCITCSARIFSNLYMNNKISDEDISKAIEDIKPKTSYSVTEQISKITDGWDFTRITK